MAVRYQRAATNAARRRRPRAVSLDDGLPERAHLLVRERAVLRLERQPERERAPAGAERLGVAPDVEDLDVAEQIPAGLARRRQHGAGGVLVADDDGDVLAQGRELRERQRLGRVAEALAQAIEVELDAHDGIVEAVAAGGQRVELADEAERLLSRHLHEALAPGMQERVVRGRHGHDAAGHADGAQDRLEHALAEEERGRLARAPPGGAAEAAAHDRAERPRLARQLLALDGVVGVRDLEQREVVAAPGGVAGRAPPAGSAAAACAGASVPARAGWRPRASCGAGRPGRGRGDRACPRARRRASAPRSGRRPGRRRRPCGARAGPRVRPPPEPTESSEGTCSSP